MKGVSAKMKVLTTAINVGTAASGAILLCGSALMSMVGNVGPVHAISDVIWSIVGILLTLLNIGSLYMVFFYRSQSNPRRSKRGLQVLMVLLATLWFVEAPVLAFWYLQVASTLAI